MSAYVSMQENIAIAELTVTETLDFAARTQGTGLKAGEQLYAKHEHIKLPSITRIFSFNLCTLLGI